MRQQIARSSATKRVNSGSSHKGNTTAIVTAAGFGKRFSLNTKQKTPKQFLKLKGKPIILYSLLALQKSKLIKRIILVSNEHYFNMIHSLADKHKISKLTLLVEGGKTRFDSVRNAFYQLSANDDDLILIHDAVRPNINSKLIDEIIKFSLKKGNTIIGTKITDTIKKEKNRKVSKTINREFLWAVQTPQVFRYKDLQQSYKKNKPGNIHTDESSMLESAGFNVNLFAGPNTNIKLTTSEDLKLLKKIMC